MFFLEQKQTDKFSQAQPLKHQPTCWRQHQQPSVNPTPFAKPLKVAGNAGAKQNCIQSSTQNSPDEIRPQRFHRMTTRVWVPGVYKVGAIVMTPPSGLANICTWYMSGIYCPLGDNMLLRTFLTRTSKTPLTR